MKIIKKMAGVVFAICMAVAVIAVPDLDASAQATLESSNVDIMVDSQYSSIIRVKYSQGDAQIKNIKTNSKNLIARQTEQEYRKYEDSYDKDTPFGYAEIGLYARKAGKYKVTFDVCDAAGAKVSKHTVKVSASENVEGTFPIRKATFANKTDAFYNLSNKASGKFKVVMNKGYKLESITMTYYNAEGKSVTETIKNNATVSLGSYAYKNEYEYSSKYSDYWYYNLSTNLFANTEFRVTYRNKKTKALGSTYYTIYRMPVN